MTGAVIGAGSSLGQGCFVAGGAVIGCRVRVQNNVSVYAGVEIEDDVFVGPCAVFTNVRNPRAEISRRDEYARTVVRNGATIGANATLLPGVVLGAYAFVGAGAVVTRDVHPFELVVGTPARAIGWMSKDGYRLDFSGEASCTCPSGERYELRDGRCIVASPS